MKKYFILYYSKTGNSKFIAEKLSNELLCTSKRIIPVIDNLLVLFLLSVMKISIPTNISRKEMQDFNEIIIVGPVWGGLLISPLRNTLKKCIKASKNIYFAVTCETKDEDRNSKYGYAKVLREAERLSGYSIKATQAFSTALVNKNNKAWSPKLSEKIKITEENFNEIMKSKLNDFVTKIKSLQKNN
jgi:flavodoxin